MSVLLESGGHRTPARGGWTFLSIAAHASLITAAVLATMRATSPVEHVRPDHLIYVAPIPPRSESQTPLPSGDPVPSLPTDQIHVDLRTLPVPGPVDLSRTTIDATIIGDIRGTMPAPGAGSAPPNGVYDETAVDRTVLPWAKNPPPIYPSQLRSSGLQGTVIVRFVVDTSGVVEQGSMSVLESTHPAFAEAVRAWLPRTRYFPAEVSGRRVRQLVQQRVEFSLR
ncbi:MAG TPA: energy transducer TonB [Gemmatimonadaceae bacterium]|nr:energy transducer TonB [Gemmatimonadaceae bacterium]